jgi:hypothetical protein
MESVPKSRAINFGEAAQLIGGSLGRVSSVAVLITILNGR